MILSSCGAPFDEIEIKFDTSPEQMLALSHDPIIGYRGKPANYHEQLTCLFDYSAIIPDETGRPRRTDFILDGLNACLRIRRINPDSLRFLSRSIPADVHQLKMTVKPEDGFTHSSLLPSLNVQTMLRREYDFYAQNYWPDMAAIQTAARHELCNPLRSKAVAPLAHYFDALHKPGDIRLVGAIAYGRHDGTTFYEGTHLAYCHDVGVIRTIDGREVPFTELEIELIPERSQSPVGLERLAERLRNKYEIETHTTSKARRTMDFVRERKIRNPDFSLGIITPTRENKLRFRQGGKRWEDYKRAFHFIEHGRYPNRRLYHHQRANPLVSAAA